jgi:hypothetical protein
VVVPVEKSYAEAANSARFDSLLSGAKEFVFFE